MPSLVAAVGDALVYGEAVLTQVAGVARLVAARVAHVLHAAALLNTEINTM